MLTTTILIAGGLVVAGTRILVKRKQARAPIWLIQRDGTRVKSYALVIEDKATTALALKQQVETSYTLATISLGLSMASDLLFEPIKWLGLPFDIATFGLLLEQVYDERHQARHGARLTAIGVFLVIFTAADRIVIITIIQWCYFFYRKVAFELQRQLEQVRPSPEPVTV
jgi:hypothetical protein